MSGKKLFEVQSVLQNASNIQKDLFGNYLTRCRQLNKEILELCKEAECKTLQGFPDTADFQKRLKRCEDNIQQFVNQLKNLEQQVERKARESSNGWYFDNEFNRAQQIKNSLGTEMSSSVRPLQQDLETGLQRAKGCLQRAEERKKAQAQAALKQFKEKVEIPRYQNPLDKDNIMTMEEFCETILGDTENSSWAASTLQQLESYRKNEQWDILLETFHVVNSELDSKITSLEQRCEDEQNKMATVVAIEKFLYDEGCEFESSIIGDKHFADGVLIRTVKTNRPLEFTIGSGGEHESDDGSAGTRVSFNIDNLQGEENCSSAVDKLRQKLQKMGIDPGTVSRFNSNRKKGSMPGGGGIKETANTMTGGK